MIAIEKFALTTSSRDMLVAAGAPQMLERLEARYCCATVTRAENERQRLQQVEVAALDLTLEIKKVSEANQNWTEH